MELNIVWVVASLFPSYFIGMNSAQKFSLNSLPRWFMANEINTNGLIWRIRNKVRPAKAILWGMRQKSVGGGAAKKPSSRSCQIKRALLATWLSQKFSSEKWAALFIWETAGCSLTLTQLVPLRPADWLFLSGSIWLIFVLMMIMMWLARSFVPSFPNCCVKSTKIARHLVRSTPERAKQRQ